MKAGLNETFHFLARTPNEAAVDVLLAGLDCPHQAIQQRSLRALLTRPSPRGHREIFRRLGQLGSRCWAIINERPERLVRAASAALESRDPSARAAALRGIVSCRLYDTMPALVARLDDRDADNAGQIAETILKLTELFYCELSDPAARSARNGLDNLRRRLTASLEVAMAAFDAHRRSEPLEAFLLVARRQNVTLQRILREPRQRSREALLDAMAHSSHGGVIRLLLSFLDDSHLPHAVKTVIAQRCDARFVEHLLEKTGANPSRSLAKTLSRFDGFAWARPGHELLRSLSGAAQYNAVKLLAASAMDRRELLGVLAFLLREGKPEGRRAAAQALAELPGPEADALILEALQQEDPGVRAELIGQVRPRQLPGAMTLLIGMVGNPHEEVRHALRTALPEFTYQQFMANFESLPERLLPPAGHLVKAIDVDVRPRLREDMESPSRVKRRRAVHAAAAMGLVRELEPSLIQRLSDEDHMVRLAAAEALAHCETMPTWEALREALFDASVAVQEAAEQSLNQISRSLQVQAEQTREEAVA